MYEADAQHQDELLKQEELVRILKRIWYLDGDDIPEDEILYLVSALGLSNQFIKSITGIEHDR